MKLSRLSAAALSAVLIAAPAFALDFQSAKSQGLVGETISGYIAPVGSTSAEVSAVVADVNAKRKAEYQRISAGNGQPLNVVEKLAAEKIIEQRLGAGDYYQDASGAWKRK